MKTRMQPIGNVWSKFPRVVRDLASACGKQVRIEMEGKETELDKTIIEAIKDPLTHIVRNCGGSRHRAAGSRGSRGQAGRGLLLLRAYHEGGQVNIEISDDGAGIDIERVKQKACSAVLITAEPSRPHERAGDLEPSFPARLLHRRESHQRLRPRRRHGRGQDQYREESAAPWISRAGRARAPRSRSRSR